MSVKLPSTSAPYTGGGGGAGGGSSMQKAAPAGYPRKCAFCPSKTEYYDASELGRHIRVAHSTKEGGSFVCRYGVNSVCAHLPPEGVSDYDYEAHIRKFHTAATELANRGLGHVTAGIESTTFTISSSAQNLASALADPSKSRSESAAFFSRHWGEAYVPTTPVPPSPHLNAIASPTLLAQLERNLKTYKKFSHTKRALKKQRAQALEDERADVDDLPRFLADDAFDLSREHSFNALFIRPKDGRSDPLVQVPGARNGKPSTQPPAPRPATTSNPFEDDGVGDDDDDGKWTTSSVEQKKKKISSSSCTDSSKMKQQYPPSKNPFEKKASTSRNPFDEPTTPGNSSGGGPGTNPFDGPEWRDRKALQARLEAMHDVVDARLASRLRAKSDAFWRLVNSYGELQADIAEARERIGSIRSNLRVASTCICTRTERMMRLYEGREEKGKLLAKLHDMSCLREAQTTVQALLSQGEYPRALECINTSVDVVDTELAGVTAFRHLSPQLTEMRNVIERMMKEELASVVQKEFGARVEEQGQIVHEGELLSVLLGLAQLRSFSFVAMLKNEIGETTKTIVRQTCKAVIVECGDVSMLDVMGDAVRKLRFRDWITLLTCVNEALYAFALRIETLQTLIVELLDRVWHDGFPDDEENMRKSSSSTPVANGGSYAQQQQELNQQAEEDSDLDEPNGSPSSVMTNGGGTTRLAPSSAVLPVDIRTLAQLRKAMLALREYACECGHARIARLFQARDSMDEKKALPSVAEVKEQAAVIEEYLKRGTQRGWSRGRFLDAAVEKSTLVYVEKFHKRRRETVCEVLDGELWKAADVPQAIQSLALQFEEEDKVMVGEEDRATGDCAGGITVGGGGEKTPQSLAATVAAEATAALLNEDTPTSSLPGSTAPSVVGETTTLALKDDRYVVVASALLTLSALHEHVWHARALPQHATRILMRTIELLKAFNSRSCQLILGAGALQLVGLKTISVKNLALASRSLQLIAHFIAIVERRFERLLKEEERQQLRHFAKVRTDYNDHIGEIVAKLASVMEHHATNCLATWTVAGAPPSAAMQTLCKQLGKFHAGLHGIMPDQQIRGLFGAVHGNVKRLLRQRFVTLKLSPQDVLSYGIVCEDFSFYARSIKAMAGCESLELGTMAEVLEGK